jgi:hypothetical protein
MDCMHKFVNLILSLFRLFVIGSLMTTVVVVVVMVGVSTVHTYTYCDQHYQNLNETVTMGTCINASALEKSPNIREACEKDRKELEITVYQCTTQVIYDKIQLQVATLIVHETLPPWFWQVFVVLLLFCVVYVVLSVYRMSRQADIQQRMLLAQSHQPYSQFMMHAPMPKQIECEYTYHPHSKTPGELTDSE